MKLILVLLLFTVSVFSQEKIETKDNLKKFFDNYNVKGSFLLYNLKEDSYAGYNIERCRKRFLPASTFKIFNSLVGVETGIIPDSNFIFYWDSTKYRVNKWNQDLILRKAFQYSCVPCYQNLARKIGMTRMKFYIEKEHYGNEILTGPIDFFWLNATLKISQFEQVEFLKKLYNEKLGFSSKATQIVKYIMLVDNKPDYKLRTKTGWGIEKESLNIGWYVGYLEKDNNVFFFATNIESGNPNENFESARIEITKSILRNFGVL
ncbi:MAG: class D beta-lactamase [Ignavibacteriaceae bacterium]